LQKTTDEILGLLVGTLMVLKFLAVCAGLLGLVFWMIG
jgi:hypothetical protein